MAKKTAAPKRKTVKARKASKPTKAAKPAGAKAAKPTKAAKRLHWLDPKSQAPLIDDYARQMESFLKAMADGAVDPEEVQEQEKHLVALMKQIEPRLDDELHELVTRLLCELTVYDVMQLMLTMQEARPASRFYG
jgi:hypothetical protein